MYESRQTIKRAESEKNRSPFHDTLIMAARVAQIMLDYDLRDLTANKLVKMGRRLFQIDAIGADEYRALTFQPCNSNEDLMLSETYRDMMENRHIFRDMIDDWKSVIRELEFSGHQPPSLPLGRKVLDMLYSFSEERFEE